MKLKTSDPWHFDGEVTRGTFVLRAIIQTIHSRVLRHANVEKGSETEEKS